MDGDPTGSAGGRTGGWSRRRNRIASSLAVCRAVSGHGAPGDIAANGLPEETAVAGDSAFIADGRSRPGHSARAGATPLDAGVSGRILIPLLHVSQESGRPGGETRFQRVFGPGTREYSSRGL